MGLPKLKFCEAYTDKVKNNKNVPCSRIAEYKVLLSYPENDNQRAAYRCMEHIHIPTKSSIVLSHQIYDQKERLEQVRSVLKSLVNQPVPNKKGLSVKGLVCKDNGILCKDDKGKYVFVFYDWIDINL
jgi:hypothetical protein